MSKCMLHEKELPKKFWVEAINIVVLLLNMLSTRVVNGQTSFEAWHWYKPLLKNLKIFGCLCFSHIPQPKRDKLDKKQEFRIFIGYSLQSKAYRIFQPQAGKILVSRDVKFVEQKQWDWDGEKQVSDTNELHNFEEWVDHLPVRGTRSLSDIYQRSNVVIFEPAKYEEARKGKK